MSAGRIGWIVWCAGWAAAWSAAGYAGVLGWVECAPLAALAFLAVLVPVGHPRVEVGSRCPLCGTAGDPAHLPAHLRTAHPRPPEPAISA